MPNRHRWPVACHMRLLELFETGLSTREIGIRISAMPEAKAFGLIATKEAVCGKLYRMRKWPKETATALTRSTKESHS